jgi:acyl-coenzyme A thioesterase PaaI-like protein
MKNQLAKIIDKLEKKPAWIRYKILSVVLGATVKFVGTAGIKCLMLSSDKAVFKLANKKKVRNHIGSVHAAASALVAETATGMALGVHIPDDKLPVLKTMHVDYVKRSTGALTAEAYLTKEQIESLHRDDKGSFIVSCTVQDEKNIEPVICSMEWAWTPKRR